MNSQSHAMFPEYPRDVIRCLSLWQPHASLIAIGEKLYETRSWSTPYRGWIAIHAAKTQDEAAFVWKSVQHAKKTDFQHALPFTQATYDAFKAWMEREHISEFNFGMLPFGAIVAVGKLVAIYDAPALHKKLTGRVREFGDFGHGRYAWRIEEVQALKTPLPYRGQQGLWALDQATIADVWKATELQNWRGEND